ncbi:hypothetical protein TWF481_002982 [Arthrobotrys musiformis]|uniref:Uncharacterized protein n=1 Tax=Arthrobotrys musiformis TaxID=47236 RepID=A0AAV9VUQ4_9PEZI
MSTTRLIGLDRIPKQFRFGTWARYVKQDPTGRTNLQLCGQLVLAAIRIKQIFHAEDVLAALNIATTNTDNVPEKVRMISPFITADDEAKADIVLQNCLPTAVAAAWLAGYSDRQRINTGYVEANPQYHHLPPPTCSYYTYWIDLDTTCDVMSVYGLITGFRQTYQVVEGDNAAPSTAAAAAAAGKWMQIPHKRPAPTAPQKTPALPPREWIG